MSYTQSKSIQGIGAVLSIGPVVGTSSPTFVPVFEITDMPFKGAEWDKREVTNFNSPNNAKEYRKGLKDGGMVTLTGNLVTDDPGQVAMAAAFEDRLNPYLFKLVMPLAIGQTTTGDTYAFSGLVLSWAPLSDLKPANEVQFKVDIQVTAGDPVKTAGS